MAAPSSVWPEAHGTPDSGGWRPRHSQETLCVKYRPRACHTCGEPSPNAGGCPRAQVGSCDFRRSELCRLTAIQVRPAGLQVLRRDLARTSTRPEARLRPCQTVSGRWGSWARPNTHSPEGHKARSLSGWVREIAVSNENQKPFRFSRNWSACSSRPAREPGAGPLVPGVGPPADHHGLGAAA